MGWVGVGREGKFPNFPGFDLGVLLLNISEHPQ